MVVDLISESMKISRRCFDGGGRMSDVEQAIRGMVRL